MENNLKITNPKLKVVGYIAPTDTMTIIVPESTWAGYNSNIEEYSGTFDSDLDVNLYISTEQDCIEKYNQLIPLFENLLDGDNGDEGIVVGVYKNGDNSVLFASDIDYSQGNGLLYEGDIIPSDKIIDMAHFNPSDLEEDHPEIFEKIKGIFHDNWD